MVKSPASSRKKWKAPQDHCDSMAPAFIDLWKKLNINYSDFIRLRSIDIQRLFKNFNKSS